MISHDQESLFLLGSVVNRALFALMAVCLMEEL